VLLPGMDGTGALFKPLISALGDKFTIRLVRYPDQALGYAALATVARRALPAKGPFLILAESFSGPIAVALAAANPPGLRGVILSSSFVRNPRPTCGVLRPLVNLLRIKSIPFSILNHLLLGLHSTAPLRSALRAAFGEIAAHTCRSRIRAVLSVDVSAKLGQVKVPLLYLLAAEDRLVPESASKAMLQVRPDMQVISISAPHLLLQVAPRTAANVIQVFVHQLRKVAEMAARPRQG
jgi:pimeloyl-ACP methyl ester carboxylesterase